MIIRNLDVNRIARVPSEAHAILIVNPYAVLSSAIALQRLEAISGKGGEINQRARVVQKSQAAACAPGNVSEAWNLVAVKDCLGIAPTETANHLVGSCVRRQCLSTLRVKRLATNRLISPSAQNFGRLT